MYLVEKVFNYLIRLGKVFNRENDPEIYVALTFQEFSHLPVYYKELKFFKNSTFGVTQLHLHPHEFCWNSEVFCGGHG